MVDFNGTNTLYNISHDYPLLVKTTWYDRSDGTGPDVNYSISEIILPKGQYNKNQLLSWLNTNFAIFSEVPEAPFLTETVYGFGSILFPAVVDTPTTSKLNLFQNEGLLTQVYEGSGVNPHEYYSFELIVNDENYRFFTMLGWKPTFAVNTQTANNAPIIIRSFLTSSTYDIISNETTVLYSTASPYEGPHVYDLSGSRMLYIYLDYPLSSKFRVPFDNCKESNLIGSIPIGQAAFGETFFYQVQNLVYASQKNITMSNISMSLRDEYDEFVDFNDIPWQMTLRIKFALSEDEAMVSAQEGTLGQNNSLPSLHPTATSYNDGGGRDILMGSQKKRKGGF